MRRLLVILGAILLVLVVVDRVAKIVAEGRAESRIQETYGLAVRPDVTVRGFPFLTQLLDRELDRVDLAVDDLVIGGFRGLDVDVTARSIELLSADEGRAAFVSGTLTVPYDDVVRLARDAGAPAIDLDYGGEPGLIAMQATVDLPTGELDIVAYSAVRVDGSQIAVRLDRVEVNDSAPAAIDVAVGRRLDFDIELPDVPGVGDIAVETVEARPGGIAVTVTGRDVPVG